MVWTISVTVLSLWFLGVAIPYTLHGHSHLLLALAVAIVMIPVFFNKQRRRD
jgi:hypothetical protein